MNGLSKSHCVRGRAVVARAVEVRADAVGDNGAQGIDPSLGVTQPQPLSAGAVEVERRAGDGGEAARHHAEFVIQVPRHGE